MEVVDTVTLTLCNTRYNLSKNNIYDSTFKKQLYTQTRERDTKCIIVLQSNAIRHTIYMSLCKIKQCIQFILYININIKLYGFKSHTTKALYGLYGSSSVSWSPPHICVSLHPAKSTTSNIAINISIELIYKTCYTLWWLVIKKIILYLDSSN